MKVYIEVHTATRQRCSNGNDDDDDYKSSGHDRGRRPHGGLHLAAAATQLLWTLSYMLRIVQTADTYGQSTASFITITCF